MSTRPGTHRALSQGLSAPICLTWELTYACNLECVHCLSSSGRRDARELTTTECLGVVDQLAEMGVFYVNIGGGEPTYRKDFQEIIDYCLERRVGVKFSTNGYFLDRSLAQRLVNNPYLDLQISLDGATAESNDAIRGVGNFSRVLLALNTLADAGVVDFKISVVVTNRSVGELDDLLAIAKRYNAQLRLTRLRPSGRGANAWSTLRLSASQQSVLHAWLLRHPQVLTGDSFFHLAPLGGELEGLNMCGAGRVVSLIDPVGEVYACPFTIHPEFSAGNLRESSFADIWNSSPLFRSLREAPGPTSCTSCQAYKSCHGGCMAAKFFTGLSYDDPDPECVLGKGDRKLADSGWAPSPDLSHSAFGNIGPPRRIRHPISGTF